MAAQGRTEMSFLTREHLTRIVLPLLLLVLLGVAPLRTDGARKPKMPAAFANLVGHEGPLTLHGTQRTNTKASNFTES